MSDPECVYPITVEIYKDTDGFCQPLAENQCKINDLSVYTTNEYNYCKDPADYRCIDISTGTICRNT